MQELHSILVDLDSDRRNRLKTVAVASPHFRKVDIVQRSAQALDSFGIKDQGLLDVVFIASSLSDAEIELLLRQGHIV